MKELNVGGVFVAPMVGYLVIACGLYLVVRRRFLPGIERRVWHPALFKLALFVILLTVVALLLS
jgi:uncharacterized membrane protein